MSFKSKSNAKCGVCKESMRADNLPRLVEIVAKRLANRHGFLNVSNKMGPAITNVLNKGYSMPFKF